MPRDPSTAALAICAQQCLKATNGHHRRWALKRCTDALLAAGTPPAIAAHSAQAMAAVAGRIAALCTANTQEAKHAA